MVAWIFRSALFTSAAWRALETKAPHGFLNVVANPRPKMTIGLRSIKESKKNPTHYTTLYCFLCICKCTRFLKIIVRSFLACSAAADTFLHSFVVKCGFGPKFFWLSVILPPDDRPNKVPSKLPG